MSGKKPLPAFKLKLIEMLQDGGSLPEVTEKSAAVCDWQRILMDAHCELTRQLCYYMEEGNDFQVNRCLMNIENIAREWRLRGPKE